MFSNLLPLHRVVRLLFWAAAAFALVMASLPQAFALPGDPNDKLLHITAFAVLALLGAQAYHPVFDVQADEQENKSGYAFVERFNGRMRDELLNETLFMSLDHAREKIAAWIDDYNNQRPHSSLGYATPAAFAAELKKQGLLCYAAPCFTRAVAQ